MISGTSSIKFKIDEATVSAYLKFLHSGFTMEMEVGDVYEVEPEKYKKFFTKFTVQEKAELNFIDSNGCFGIYTDNGVTTFSMGRYGGYNSGTISFRMYNEECKQIIALLCEKGRALAPVRTTRAPDEDENKDFFKSLMPPGSVEK